jgi:receptor protein-tyrosine kinase
MSDYILIDTPPSTMMSDASVLAARADKVIYVIRRDYASTAQILDGVQSLLGTGAKLCGFVFNRASSGHGTGYGYGYGYGHYGYGYGYGYGKKGYSYSGESKKTGD